MRRALTAGFIFATLVGAAATAAAQHRVHVHEVRVGAHPDFDRVVVELDGTTDVTWERGPQPGAESFYLDADLGRRSRLVHTSLERVGDVRLTAMRVGTRVELEPRERRIRAYVLPKPTRLVIDLAAPGPEPFAVPKGITPLEPATSVEPRSEAAPEAEPEPEPEAGPPAEEVAPESGPEEPEAPPSAETPQPEEPKAEPAPAPEAPPESQPEAAAPPPAPPPPAVQPPVVPPPRAVAPEPAPGFPWALSFGTLAFIAALVVSYLYVRELLDRPAEPQRLPRSPAGGLTPSGVDPITPAELRTAAEATGVLEQRLDEEVRARVALEERLAQAGEELKVLRDRVHRVERRRDEAL